MGVLDDEKPHTAQRKSSSKTKNEQEEMLSKDYQSKEKGHRTKASNDVNLKGWEIKRNRHKSEDTNIDANKIVHKKFNRQRSDDTSDAVKSPRKYSDDSSSERKSPIKRQVRRPSPEKTEESCVLRHTSPTSRRNSEIKHGRKISPAERKFNTSRPKDWRHCRHISEPGDVRSYRTDCIEVRNEGGRSGFFRSSSVRTNKTSLPEDNRTTTLRCGCKVTLPMQDNKELELKRQSGSACQAQFSPTTLSPRQRKASPSPQLRGACRRW